MADYTECQAYKHLLQVCENIIYSSDIDSQIIKKYEQLKKSITKKISKQKQGHHLAMLSTYRLILDNTIRVIQTFQQELEQNMERSNYNAQILDMNAQVQVKIKEMQEGLENGTSKMRLLYKQEINALKYQFDQLDSKFQNLGLLIEVHKKMHEIILQATKAEQKRGANQQKQKQRVKRMEQMIDKIGDINDFVEQHKITQEKYSQYKLATKHLNKLLFNN